MRKAGPDFESSTPMSDGDVAPKDSLSPRSEQMYGFANPASGSEWKSKPNGLKNPVQFVSWACVYLVGMIVLRVKRLSLKLALFRGSKVSAATMLLGSLRLFAELAARPFKRNALSKKGGILRSAIIAAGIVGFFHVGEPIEDWLRGGRDVIRLHPSSGKIVVVGVDEKSIQEIGSFPVARGHFGDAVERLLAAGASRVYFDWAFSQAENATEDRRLGDALRRHKDRVFAGSIMEGADLNGSSIKIEPIPAIGAGVKRTGLDGEAAPFNLSYYIPGDHYKKTHGVTPMSWSLAGVEEIGAARFRPDWSIDYRSVPTVSLVDVLYGRVSPGQFKEKDVIIAPMSARYHDAVNQVWQGWLAGVYVHVIGAETLRQGKPVELAWLPWFLVAAAFSIMLLWSDKRRNGAVGVVFWSSLVLVPFIADWFLIQAEIVPAALLFAVVTYRARSLAGVEGAQEKNARSELDNATLMNRSEEGSARLLVAMKVRNASRIEAFLSKAQIKRFWAELAKRARLGDEAMRIYHHEDSLLWVVDLASERELRDHFDGLRHLICAPVELDSLNVDPIVSFGVDAQAGIKLVDRIGTAILAAEEALIGGSKIYDPEKRAVAEWELSLLGELDRGLENGEVRVAYQAKVDLASGNWLGFEALARWVHPVRGEISPGEFIPLAEKNDRIEALTRFVLDETLRACSALQMNGLELVFSVNVSTKSIRGDGFYFMIREAVQTHGVDPRHLMIEITETEAIENHHEFFDALTKVVDFGVGISIDDFGAGSAGLDYLRHFPALEVKVDREFVWNIDRSVEDQLFVRSIVDLAHSMNRKVVAEGIETEAVAKMAHELGCDVGQGYFFSRPMSFDDIAQKFQWDSSRRLSKN